MILFFLERGAGTKILKASEPTDFFPHKIIHLSIGSHFRFQTKSQTRSLYYVLSGMICFLCELF